MPGHHIAHAQFFPCALRVHPFAAKLLRIPKWPYCDSRRVAQCCSYFVRQRHLQEIQFLACTNILEGKHGNRYLFCTRPSCSRPFVQEPPHRRCSEYYDCRSYCSPYLSAASTSCRYRRHCRRTRVSIQPLQLRQHFCRGLESQLRIFFQRLRNDVVEFGRNYWSQSRDCHRFLMQDRVKDLYRRITRERARSRRHLIQHSAQREEIATRVHLLPKRLFRRHVGDRPHRVTRNGHRRHI